jgi:hypothetical protein
MLQAGSINLTTVRLLGPHLTADNHRAVLESARGKKKAEVEEIVARLAPRPDVASSVRRLPATKAAPARSAASPPPLPGSAVDGITTVAPDVPTQLLPGAVAIEAGITVAPPATAPPARTEPRPASVKPLSPDRYRVQVTISGETLEKLRLAKDMLRHAIPSGDEAVILDRALTVLLEDLARGKFAATGKPRASRGIKAGSRHIPAEVKRAVWLRDLGRCAFIGTDGRRCGERAFLEFHHVRPYAVGGPPTVENVRLACRTHNGHEARVYFGHPRQGEAGFIREGAPPYGGRSLGVTTRRRGEGAFFQGRDSWNCPVRVQPVDSTERATRSGTSSAPRPAHDGHAPGSSSFSRPSTRRGRSASSCPAPLEP